MSWFGQLFGKKETSSNVAKRRLQMVLIHDRSDISPGLMEQIRDEIIQVIVKHLSIDPSTVEVSLTQSGQENLLVAEVPLPGNGRRAAD
ncbi:MAG: cell division topological specificity factor MinE [Chloroflexota bacterium]|nr:cell division topological specificity factor MinE [Anaerolineales bacterium]MCB8989294.1 cell division topological specificity factor MinE [Ardenticatenaceae bacterium]